MSDCPPLPAPADLELLRDYIAITDLHAARGCLLCKSAAAALRRELARLERGDNNSNTNYNPSAR